MARPGTTYSRRDAGTPRTAPTDTGTLFIVGLAANVVGPTLVQNATEARAVLGADIPQSAFVADMEVAFARGLRRAYVVGLTATATDADRIAALAGFGRKLGPGQVVLHEATTAAAHVAAIAHADANNRRAFLDVPKRTDEPDFSDDYVSVLSTAVAGLRSNAAVVEEASASFAGGPIVPAAVPGTTRRMSGATAAAALVAVVDGAGNPNVPAAGELGRFDLALSVEDHFTDAQVTTLANAGVNVFTDDDGVQLYGFRTLADRTVKPDHWQLSNVRLDMAVVARADAIAKRHVFKIIDSEGDELSAYGGELTSMLGEYVKDKAIFRKDGDAGFSVDVTPAVNTPATIADGRIIAILSYRRAPFAESVEVEHVVIGVNQSL
jgi:hypothetical protein